jgi:hypothetical protein
MPTFNVKCFNAGRWDRRKPREVEANTEKEAAELVCGGPLMATGQDGHYRAQVYLPSRPDQKKHFWVPPDPMFRG